MKVCQHTLSNNIDTGTDLFLIKMNVIDKVILKRSYFKISGGQIVGRVEKLK